MKTDFSAQIISPQKAYHRRCYHYHLKYFERIETLGILLGLE